LHRCQPLGITNTIITTLAFFGQQKRIQIRRANGSNVIRGAPASTAAEGLEGEDSLEFLPLCLHSLTLPLPLWVDSCLAPRGVAGGGVGCIRIRVFAIGNPSTL